MKKLSDNFWAKSFHTFEIISSNLKGKNLAIVKGRVFFFHQAGDKPNLSPNESTGVCKHFPIKPSHFWGKLTMFYTMKATIESHNAFSSLQRAQNSLPYPKTVSKVQYWWVIGCQNFREKIFFENFFSTWKMIFYFSMENRFKNIWVVFGILKKCLEGLERPFKCLNHSTTALFWRFRVVR